MFCKSCGNEIKEGTKFCTKCGNETPSYQIPIKKKKFFTKKITILILSILLVVGITLFLSSRSTNSVSVSDQRNLDIASTVVNIYCAGEIEEEDSGGSGTILTEDGLILTNAHIVPLGAEETVSCVVVLPDPSTGTPDEMYTAYPIIIPELSEQYDLAFVQIDDVFYDQEEGVVYGEYPKIFPAYDSSKYCKNENVKLGEPVRIYGYPSISGGYALTITDGIVSSLLIDEGLIVTSAKISHGNSGGLAVDQYGCSIGIPSMVSSDESESLGIIISNDLIGEFMDEISVLDEY